MKIDIFNGSEKIVRKSGVGRAIEHQRKVLRESGITVDDVSMKEADIVQINTVFPDSVAAAICARMLKKKVVYYGHSTMEDFRDSFVGSNLAAPFFKQWIKFCYSLGDVIVTPSDYSKNLLVEYGIKKPIYAVSNGIDIDFWKKDREGRRRFREKYGFSEDDKVVISVGHYINRKGITEFIDLAKKMPGVAFIWFGYTPLKLVPEEIRRAINDAPENAHFPGYIEKEELREAYQGADLFCFMSHEETEGIVVLEALACEIPTLVRNIHVYDGWLTEGKNVYKCDDDQAFYVKAVEVLCGSLPSLARGGYEVAESRSFRNVGKMMKRVYASI